jgi:hypothetical protein
VKSKLFRYLSRHQAHRPDRFSRRDHLELQRKLSSFHQDGSPSGDQERRSPLWKLQYTTRQYAKAPTQRYAFRKGDTVRISHVRQPFDREYDERWPMEYFVVMDRGMKEGILYYTLKDTSGDAVQGTFYQPELNSVKVTEQTMYRIENIIRRRRNDALFKWMGWPSKFNSWIPTVSLKDYKRSEG